MPVMPAIFVSHGSPMLALDPTPAHAFLAELGASLGKPRAVVCVSAHWESRAASVGTSPAPKTVHDFGGFSDSLYQIEYPARGDPELALRVSQLLEHAGFACALDRERGFDHGVWVPMRLMYPLGDVSVVPFAVVVPHDAARHLAMGRALRPLLDEGVLVLGSGGAVHNLHAVSLGIKTQAAEWAVTFDNWLRAAVDRGDDEALVNWQARAPGAAMAHPRAEHFMPLLVAAGAAGTGFHGEVLHHSWDHGSLSLSAFAFHAAESPVAAR